MRIGTAIEETWAFYEEIHADLAQHHQVSVFEAREVQLPVLRDGINRLLFRRDLEAFLRENDVVFFEWASRLLAAATRLPKLCPIVTRLHRYELFAWVDQINWEAVDQVILVSHAMRRKLIDRVPSLAERTVTVPNAVSTTKYYPVRRRFKENVGILCHLTPRKRVYELVLALNELFRQRQDLHLHIAGDQRHAHRDYYDALQSLVHKMSLRNRVTFHGWVSRPWDWYRGIDIYVSNSFSEGLQTTPIEAMASGCYCLAHRWDGAEELLPPENLYTTDTELREKIVGYLALPDSQKQARCKLMREIVEARFDIRDTAAAVREILEGAALSGPR